MPRGKYVNHKGRGRSFTSPEELAREQKDMQNKKNAKANRKPKRNEDGEEISDSDSDSSNDAENLNKNKDGKDAAAAAGDGSGEDSSSDEEDDENRKAKGVEGLLSGQIENPNRRVIKQKKLSQLEDTSGGGGTGTSGGGSAGGGAGGSGNSSSNQPVELSRREREAIEKVKAKERYQKLHAEGKTEEARKDLARLAIIRKEREEAAAKRAADNEQKQAFKQTKVSETAKALGKK